MAYLVLSNRKGVKIPNDKAQAILEVLEGRAEPEDDKQADFILKVSKVYFSWVDVSNDYMQTNADYVIPAALAHWAVDSDGTPSRPDSHHSWLFAKSHKIWISGRPSKATQFYIDKIRNEKSFKRNVLGNRHG